MLHSNYHPLGPVALPPFRGRRHYTHTFDLSAPSVPAGYEDYLAPVTALCRAAGATSGYAHLTVDESVVLVGATQRRPRPHVDGHYVPGSGWMHQPSGWVHHRPRMPIVVASSVVGCRVWRGAFDATPRDDGDLSHIAHELGEGTMVPARVGERRHQERAYR